MDRMITINKTTTTCSISGKRICVLTPECVGTGADGSSDARNSVKVCLSALTPVGG